jgi:CheY-like chemotaxis protein
MPHQAFQATGTMFAMASEWSATRPCYLFKERIMQIGVDSQRAVENKRVFVIDNDEINSIALQFMLADECETHVFADLDSALHKGLAWPPQLVLLGAGMLEAEGAEIVPRLKAQHPALKILLVCDSVEPAPVKQALLLGANATLLRPLLLETVRRKVDAQLGRRTAIGIAVTPG